MVAQVVQSWGISAGSLDLEYIVQPLRLHFLICKIRVILLLHRDFMRIKWDNSFKVLNIRLDTW